jgi:hypothetical protein
MRLRSVVAIVMKTERGNTIVTTMNAQLQNLENANRAAEHPRLIHLIANLSAILCTRFL